MSACDKYGVHADVFKAYAHYGCRDQRYKLIFWYNEALGIEGANEADADKKEWELFDCQEDPLELFNVYHEEKYREVRSKMKALLEGKMMELGDEVVHEKDEDEGRGTWTERFGDVEVRRKSSMLGRLWGGGGAA